METSIVIPNYNGFIFLENCLESLRAQSYQKFEIIFVDNASTDRSVSYVKENYPWVKVIQCDQNFGFSKAVNEGIRNAAGKYVVLLNTDTCADPNWLEQLVAFISADERMFSCSSKMIQFNNPDLIDDAGDEYTIMGWAYQVGHGMPVTRYNRPRKIFSTCAGAGIYRKEVFDEIGYFDERYFAYLEDVDISLRAAINGYTNWYCPEAKVLHVGSAASGGGMNPFKVRLSARNNVYLIYNNFPLLMLLINLPFLIVGVIVRLIFFKEHTLRQAYWSGFIEGTRTLDKKSKKTFKWKNSVRYLRLQFALIKSAASYIWIKIFAN